VNPLIFLPFALLVIPFIPAILEILKRKDKGPKKIPEQTTYEEKPNLEKLNVSRLERARVTARVKKPGEIMRVMGDVSIPAGTEIDNHLVVQGNLKIGMKSHVYGSVKAFGDVEIGESSIVEGHVLSEGTVIIRRDCIVKGVVDSLKDIILEENAIVEAISTERTVKVGPNAKINRRILSGTSISTSPQLPQEEVKEVKPAEETKQIQKAEEAPELKEGAEEAEVTDQIFSYLEDRIRKLEEKKGLVAPAVNLEGLTPIEAKVLKTASMCSSLEEVCLRLFMDPLEVKAVVDRLVEKGFLDKNLKLRGPVPRERLPRKASEIRPKQEELQAPIEKTVTHVKPTEKPQEISDEELIERLIASKMRDELKRKMQTREDKSSGKVRETQHTLKKNTREEASDVDKDNSKRSRKVKPSRGKEATLDEEKTQ
jgi:cytoskeletal protein CcmA (bactofilin family)